MDRREFCKLMAGAMLMAPVSALANCPLIEVAKKKQYVASIGGALPATMSATAGGDEPVKDYLYKIRHPDEYNHQDLVLDAQGVDLLQQVLARLQRLCDAIGYGNFALLGFDEALQFGKSFPIVGAFTKAECAFLEEIFFRDAAEYGFMGDKQISNLTWSTRENDCVKVSGSGNFLFRGDAAEKFSEIQADLGDDVVLTSGIRGVMKQFYLFLRKAERHGGNLSLASRSLAPPGYSFHATGDFDIGQRGLGPYNFTEQFTATSVFKRLTDQGLIHVRYDRDNFLGVRYEPWHIRL